MMNEEQTGRTKTLDGWRGIAIIMVLVQHYQAAFPGNAQYSLGQHGVQLFFVLSGYLITSQILSDERFDLKAFYIRRAFRILPPALLYLSVLVLLTAFTPFRVCGNDIWACLFFFRNYVAETAINTCTGHFWSLSLEEQFYLLWPALIVLLGRRKASFAAAGLAAAIAIYRIRSWSFYALGLHALRTEVRADGLLVGCVLGVALTHIPIRQWVERFGMILFWPALVFFAFDVVTVQSFIPLHESVAIAIMLGASSRNPETLVGRLLEWKFLKISGVLSYSIYIWQGLFLRPNWGIFGFVLLGSSIIISYCFVEQPARKLGRRLAKRAATNSAVLASPACAVSSAEPEAAQAGYRPV
jgi:peptidoglycan/LPS O-acetylase OafA/YrhL